MRWRGLLVLGCLALSARAQQRPVYEPDDYVDPNLHKGAVLISRVVGGAVANAVDDYRPLHDDLAFLQLASDVYWSRYQFGWKHTGMHARSDLPRAFVCNCASPVYFPTPPLASEVPAAPPAGSRDLLQLAWYPSKLRYRLTWTWQPIDRTIRSAATGEVVARLHGREQSLGIDGDTHIRIAGRDLFGLVTYARRIRYGTINDRKQQELAYTHRFRARAAGTVLFFPTLTAGNVSNRGGTAINLVNPQLEVSWLEPHTNANLHLVYSPQLLNSGADGWRLHHQVALFFDRALLVRLFEPL